MPNGSYDITAVVVNHNGGVRLLETIRSLRAQENVNLEVLVYDDGSTDDSVQILKSSGLADQVNVSDENTKNANLWRAAGMEATQTDLVLVTDNDVEFEPHCLAILAATLEEDCAYAAVTPAIYNTCDREHPYSLGSLIHFLGLTVRVKDAQTRIIDSVGSGITMYSKKRLGAIGTYDAGMPIGWGDDGEIHQRIRLAGLRAIVNREAKIFHEFKPFSPDRAYRVRGAAHNRLRFIFTHYSLGTLIGLLPLLIAFEIFQTVFYAASGLGKAYISGVAQFFGNPRDSLRLRKFIQGLRHRPDRELLVSDEVFIPAHVRAGKGPLLPLFRFANTLLGGYWRALTWMTRSL